MNHKRILDKLTATAAVDALDAEIRSLLAHRRSSDLVYAGPDCDRMQEPLLARWQFALDAERYPETSDIYAAQCWLALATLLHKYGITHPKSCEKALVAIDLLNDKVVLADSFFHQADAMKAFLGTEPVIPKKKPGSPKALTFYREGDLLAIRYQDIYLAAYVYRIQAPNAYPLIGFYQAVFDQLPTTEELLATPAAGDAAGRVNRLYLPGLTYLPDPAGQVILVDSAIRTPPDETHLKDPIGLGTMYSLSNLQWDLEQLSQRF